MAKNVGLVLMKPTAPLSFSGPVSPFPHPNFDLPTPNTIPFSLQFPMRSSHTMQKQRPKWKAHFPASHRSSEAEVSTANNRDKENIKNKIQVMFQTFFCCRHCAASCHRDGMANSSVSWDLMLSAKTVPFSGVPGMAH